MPPTPQSRSSVLVVFQIRSQSSTSPWVACKEPQARADLSLSDGRPVFILIFPPVTCRLIIIDGGFVPQPRIADERLPESTAQEPALRAVSRWPRGEEWCRMSGAGNTAPILCSITRKTSGTWEKKRSISGNRMEVVDVKRGDVPGENNLLKAEDADRLDDGIEKEEQPKTELEAGVMTVEEKSDESHIHHVDSEAEKTSDLSDARLSMDSNRSVSEKDAVRGNVDDQVDSEFDNNVTKDEDGLSEKRSSVHSNASVLHNTARTEKLSLETTPQKNYAEHVTASPVEQLSTENASEMPTPPDSAATSRPTTPKAELQSPVSPIESLHRENGTVSPIEQTSTEDASETSAPPDEAATSRPTTPKVDPQPPITPSESLSKEQRESIRDSMASIPLSESSLDYDHLTAQQVEAALTTPKARSNRHTRRPSSLEILQGDAWRRPELERKSTLFDTTKDEPWKTPTTDDTPDVDQTDFIRQEQAEGSPAPSSSRPPRFSSLITTPVPAEHSSDSGSSSPVEVDWQQLDANEREEKQDKDLPEGVEDESTAFLLARLEQENAKITAAASHKKNSSSITHPRKRSESRPPSMGQLKKLVQDRNPRYSMSVTSETVPEESVPEPPPMTELEFWAALVQDYPSTASRLPTLTTSKIRSGIPPPLRGVVWTSMSGARDRELEEAFEKLQHEKSPYDGQINKDVGRSFPGVELFRDAEGEGQKMLGRVLKCFSLQDKDIGYCQGLGFLVGPLLMNMGEREAFCVLVRLMDHYSLRPSFLPSLSGLHMRIFQFSSLLRQHHTQLADHLEELGIEPAYLSQWFLSCFAVTCPLPMLFRIYDVIFAEGANETVMRVALALMRRNEPKMLEATEFEEVMQLLLGRGIWDVYAMSADELVDDFTSLGGIITHARLAELEAEFERGQGTEVVGERAGFLPDVQAAASRFLGRLWAPSGHTPTKSTSTLSPHTAEEGAKPQSAIRTPGFLRRSASKQSISTLNESDSSSGSASLASTAQTDSDVHDTAARDSQATDTYSFKSKPDSLRTVSISTGHNIPGPSKEERDMHGQIEDLLTALSEMQREQQQLASMLQREREERGEDQSAVKKLVQKLKQGTSEEEDEGEDKQKEERRRTLPPPRKVPDEAAEGGRQRPKSMMVGSKGDQDKAELENLLEKVDERLHQNNRISASFETKAQLRDRLARTRECLTVSENSCRDLTSRLEVAESSLEAFTSESEDLRSEVKELRVRVNEEFKARQKLEHTIRELRAGARTVERKDRDRVQRAESAGEVPTLGRRSSIVAAEASGKRGSINSAPVSMVGGSGLRELKLGKRDSSSSLQSLPTRRHTEKHGTPPSVQIQTRSSSSDRSGNVPAVISTSPEEHEEDDQTVAHPSPPQTPSPAAPADNAASSASSMAPALPSPKLDVPKPAGGSPWHARTSSLATKEVFSTPQHEVVPDEALLLELVNAKTSEAQARAELDEMRRALTMNNRRQEAMIMQLRSEMEAAKAAAEVARLDATRSAAESAKANQTADAAKAEATMNALNAPGLSVPSTPGANDNDSASPGSSTTTTPGADEQRSAPPPEKKSESRSASSGGGWFWGRRAASNNTPKAVVTPPAD
ncbi:RabGAP/TBC [Hortaea werneckii]|nr:RabGAP/TBC [Hortaea werneckii]